MIARMWRGVVRIEKITEYVEIVERTGMSGYRQAPGNVAAQILTRELGDGHSEIVTLSWWRGLDEIKAFAGEQIEVAKYYPEDDDYLVAPRDETVKHFEVAPAAGGSGELLP